MTNPMTDDCDSFTRGLRGYVASVASRLGVGLESCCFDTSQPSQVYLALDERLDQFPGRDLALLWDEETGWTAAVETGCGEDMIIVSLLGGNVVPDPAAVAAFAMSLNNGRHDAIQSLTRHRSCRTELDRCLAPYAVGVDHPA